MDEIVNERNSDFEFGITNKNRLEDEQLNKKVGNSAYGTFVKQSKSPLSTSRNSIFALKVILGINMGILLCDITQTFYKAYGNTIWTDTFMWGFSTVVYRVCSMIWEKCMRNMNNRERKGKTIWCINITFQILIFISSLFLGFIDYFPALEFRQRNIGIFYTVMAIMSFVIIDTYGYLHEDEITDFYFYSKDNQEANHTDRKCNQYILHMFNNKETICCILFSLGAFFGCLLSSLLCVVPSIEVIYGKTYVIFFMI